VKDFRGKLRKLRQPRNHPSTTGHSILEHFRGQNSCTPLIGLFQHATRRGKSISSPDKEFVTRDEKQSVKDHRPDAILVEPVGTPMRQVAQAAVAAGMGWGILNREAEYIADFRRSSIVPVFAVTPDQEEVGRIQGQQLA
jgi:hypothetical protein